MCGDQRPGRASLSNIVNSETLASSSCARVCLCPRVLHSGHNCPAEERKMEKSLKSPRMKRADLIEQQTNCADI